MFTTHNILEVVDGTTPRPGTAGDVQEKWDKSNNEAYTILLMSMNDEQVELVSGCRTSAQIWNKLKDINESSSGENIQLLWQKFYSVMCGVGKSPVKSMCEIQNLAAN